MSLSYSRKFDQAAQDQLRQLESEIHDSEILYHGAPSEWAIDGGTRIKHKWFSKPGMSVDRASLSSLEDSHGRYQRNDGIRFACVTSGEAGPCRVPALRQVVAPDPITEANPEEREEVNPAHALVYGKKQTDGVRQQLSAIFLVVAGTRDPRAVAEDDDRSVTSD